MQAGAFLHDGDVIVGGILPPVCRRNLAKCRMAPGASPDAFMQSGSHSVQFGDFSHTCQNVKIKLKANSYAKK